MTTTPHPARVARLIREGVPPHRAVASARERERGIASRKKQIRSAAKFYDRTRDLPNVYPEPLTGDLLEVHDDIGRDWTRHILLKLARLLKYHRTNPLGRRLMVTNIAIAMVGEATILRRQLERRAA